MPFDRWTTFRSQNGGPLTKTATFTLRLDPKAAPAEIDFIQSNTDSLLGAYDLKGDTLKIIVRTNNAAAKGRARDRTNPTPNDCILQLERTKP